jgi:ribonuclease Z
MFEILFLGTGASVPSRDRSLPCVAVRQGRSISLFDCGEGSQRQLMISPFSFMKIDRIFITHLHGDHILGLPGLLQTMGMSGRRDPVSVYGPTGLLKALKSMLDACEGELEYELRIEEVEGDEEFSFDSFDVTVFSTVHNTPSVGYVYREHDRPGIFNKEKAEKLGLTPGEDFSRLQAGETVNGITPDQVIGPKRPGCSLVYTGDTVPCKEIANASKDVDVLIHEATYTEEDSGLAKEHFHSTAKAAAETAAKCNVKMLALIHISNRYGDSEASLAEAKPVFGNTVAPEDFQILTVTNGSIRSA